MELDCKPTLCTILDGAHQAAIDANTFKPLVASDSSKAQEGRKETHGLQPPKDKTSQGYPSLSQAESNPPAAAGAMEQKAEDTYSGML